MTEADALWKTCSEALRSQVSEGTWLTWFDQIRPARADGERLVLAVPSTVVKERVESRYLSLVRDVVSDAAGHPVDLEFEVQTLATAGDLGDPGSGRGLLDGGVWSAPMPEPAAPAPAPAAPAIATNTFEDTPLDPRYTFEAFVIGASNRFAHAAALSVAETPAKSYNPLFIYGDAGLGKTHLLHAIGNYIRENFPSRYVKYVSTEMFMNEYVDMIRTNSGPAFRRRYRECDVLLIDDVQFMENKEGLQEEFFHTFNSLYGASKQIVITSDRPPKSIATLEDRLRTRFLSGLITDVQPPELETRLAILRKKAEGERVHVPDDVLEFIASNVKDNIRELEGALIRVSAYASLQRQPLTLELAEQVLADLVGADHPRQITPQTILEATAKMFGFSIEDICGHNRRRPLVTARQVSMYVFREVTDFSYPAIAREFGGRDHTTVIHAVEKVAALMKERRDIFDKVDELIKTVRSGG